MSVILDLVIRCDAAVTARKLVEVLRPDNRHVPPDQTLVVSREREKVTLTVKSERPGSALSSVESVLNDAALFQEVWLLSRPRESLGMKDGG